MAESLIQTDTTTTGRAAGVNYDHDSGDLNIGSALNPHSDNESYKHHNQQHTRTRRRAHRKTSPPKSQSRRLRYSLLRSSRLLRLVLVFEGGDSRRGADDGEGDQHDVKPGLCHQREVRPKIKACNGSCSTGEGRYATRELKRWPNAAQKCLQILCTTADKRWTTDTSRTNPTDTPQAWWPGCTKQCGGSKRRRTEASGEGKGEEGGRHGSAGLLPLEQVADQRA